MRRLYPVIAIIAIALVVTIGVFGRDIPFLLNAPQPQSSKPKVLVTFYPIYDVTLNIAGNKATVSLLVPMSVDVHRFEPTPSSIASVAGANILVYNGAGLEPWIPQIVNAAGNSRLIVVDSSQGVTLLAVPPAFQKDNRTVDPHIWLDPVIAKQQLTNILQGLIKADQADQAYFTANAQAYQSKLDYLNSELVNGTQTVATREFVTFHTAFGYFAKEYNLIQVPVFGPFEEEPTPSDIQNVENVVNRDHLCYVGFESLENTAMPDRIAADTHAKPILMDPIEGLSSNDQAVGKTYLTKMQDNINNILWALNHVGC
ncbi:hypothetical protein AUG19_07935 [archaeon 13_1_20CM_2_54_9]|nr:MAG: hypothetical protein AUJ07_10265 [Crenarchaeota archaeon 13_1_40CM_3_53_5]OLE74844.1 MAG: hypothetical protein AUG19_07935 [archaeon 13_1_20CM_2_54_9]